MPLTHLLINAALIPALLVAAYYACRNQRPLRLRIVTAVIFLLGIAQFCLSRRPDLFFRVLPFSWAFFYSNLYPYLAAVFIPPALLSAKTRMGRIRIALLCAALFTASLFPWRFFVGQDDAEYEHVVDTNGITRQTAPASCAAAAGATLLRQYGMEVSESRVANLAYTKLPEVGTDPLGLVRALKILTAHDDSFRVTIRGISFARLMQGNKPAVIIVGLPRKLKTPRQRMLMRECHWYPGAVHAVTFLGADEERPGHVKIGEPDYGLEHWPEDHLEELFRNTAIFVK